MTTQQIAISLEPSSLTTLQELGYALYVLQAFETTNTRGQALVWAAATTFANTTTFQVQPLYEAYVSTSPQDGSGVVIVQTVSVPAVLGDIATFEAGGGLTTTSGGYAAGVSIRNTTTTPYSAGLSTKSFNAESGFTQIAAVPLQGLAQDIVAPLATFLVTFSTNGTSTGQPLPYSMSQSLLIDMTVQAQVEATFDVNNGWSFGDAAWGETVAAGADLFAILAKEAPLTGTGG